MVTEQSLLFHRDIKDRTVLRLYESDSEDPQRVRDPPPEIRGKQMQVSRETTPPRIPEQVWCLANFIFSDLKIYGK